MDLKDLLKRTNLFSALSADDLEEIKQNGKIKTIAKNAIIFSQGQEATGAYVVIDGKVKVYKLGIDGRQYILHIFRAGDMFAESTIFAGNTYPAFAQALVDVKVFYISKAYFLHLIKNKSSLTLKMLASQAKRLREFAVKIEDLSLKEVSSRLARYLLEQIEIGGRKTEAGLQIQIPMNKTQLAAYLGTISETLSRTFATFKKRNIIEEHNNIVLIKDLDSLHLMSR